MKEFIEVFKKLWSNKRTRALAILLIYFIFFVFVFTVTKNSYVQPKELYSTSSTFDDILNKTIAKVEIDGDYHFIYENGKIIYEDNIYDVFEVDELNEYDLSIFTVSNINKLLKNANLESTNYVEHSNTYLVSFIDFNSIIYDNDIDIDGDVHIKLYDDYSKVIIYFENYQAQIDLRS